MFTATKLLLLHASCIRYVICMHFVATERDYARKINAKTEDFEAISLFS